MNTVFPSKIGLDIYDGRIELPDELSVSSKVTSKLLVRKGLGQEARSFPISPREKKTTKKN